RQFFELQGAFSLRRIVGHDMAEFDDDRLLRPAGATIGGCKSGRTDGRCELAARKLHLVLLVPAAPHACGRMRSSKTLEPTPGRRVPFLVVPTLGCLPGPRNRARLDSGIATLTYAPQVRSTGLAALTGADLGQARGPMQVRIGGPR